MRWYAVSVDGQLVEERLIGLRNLWATLTWCAKHADNLLTLRVRMGTEWSDPWND